MKHEVGSLDERVIVECGVIVDGSKTEEKVR